MTNADLCELLREAGAYVPADPALLLGIGQQFTDVRALVMPGGEHAGPVFEWSPWDGGPLLIPTGMESAVIGDCGGTAIMSTPLVLGIYEERDGMAPDEAREFFYVNCQGAYVGEDTPIFVEHLAPLLCSLGPDLR